MPLHFEKSAIRLNRVIYRLPLDRGSKTSNHTDQNLVLIPCDLPKMEEEAFRERILQGILRTSMQLGRV